MKVPYWLQGVMFGPALIGILFLIRLACHANAGSMCFADRFLMPTFIPLVSFYKIFGSAPLLIAHEPVFILLYWALVGLLLGVALDLLRKREASL